MPRSKPPARFTAGQDDHGRRLERVLCKLFPDVPRSAINKALRKGDIRILGKRVKGDHRVEEGDRIEVRAPFGGEARPPGQRGTPQERRGEGKPPSDKGNKPRVGAAHSTATAPGGELEILYRDEEILAVNKPAGVAVHGAGSITGRVRALLAADGRYSLSFRPGPLHRLDKPTTGVLVFGVSLEGSKRFSRALREKLLTKLYLGLLGGTLDAPARWEDSLPGEKGAQEAELTVIPVLRFSGATLAVCIPHTGRTHQIRRQAALRGHALLGDHAYQKRGPAEPSSPGDAFFGAGGTAAPTLAGGYVLHALSLTAPPAAGLAFSSIFAPLPEATANRLADWIARSGAVELALPEGPLRSRLVRPVERLTEEIGSAAFLLSAMAAEIHDLRDELHANRRDEID